MNNRSEIFKDMTQLLEEKSIGNYSLQKYTIPADSFRARLSGIKPGNYIRLMEKGNLGSTLLMSNTWMEQRTNLDFIFAANGDVLIGGLGLGMIIFPLLDKEEVKSITIIEKSPEVIEMVASQLDLPKDKVTIINDDIFNYVPERKFDTIYIDIWPYINSTIYEEEMKPLKQRYRKYLVPKKDNPDRYIACWCEYEAKNDLRI